MPGVEEVIKVKASADDIFAIISDFLKFPEIMENVRDVQILEEGDGWKISKWISDVDGRVIEWTEKDHIKPEENRIDFELVKGDLKAYGGFWQLEEESDEVNIRFRIDFEFGMPVIAALIHPLLARVLRANMKEMLSAIKWELEKPIEMEPAEA